MRTYRLEIRLIQVAVILSALVVISGFWGAWGNTKIQAVSTNESSRSTSSPATPVNNPKIVAIGDSFTYGYPGNPGNSWTERLAKELQVPVVNKGKTYQTAKDLLSRFEQDVIAEKPGRVIIFVGAGDALRGVTLKDFQTNIQAMVDKARANHITPVLALPMPYPGVQQQIREFREWELNYAQNEKILVLDFASVLFNSEGKYLEGLSKDGKYPAPKGYEVMGDYAARVLR